MNLPNKLTVGRLILTMVFIVLATAPDPSWEHFRLCRIIGYMISIVAGFTDLFDGYLARKYNLETTFGKLFDPLADKIFTVSCFVILVESHIVPAWIAVLILTREFAVTGLRSLAASKGLILVAAKSGKFKTVAQMLVLLMGGAIWVYWLPENMLIWDLILYLLAAFTVYTGIEYYIKNKSLYLNEI